MAELTEAQKKAIDNYGKDVRTLKDFVEACQTRPGQFIGPIGNAGFLNMMREIFQNAVDQIIDQTSPATWFKFSYDERSLEVTVEDGGKSFPYQDMMRMITKEYTSKNYTKVKGDYSSGLNGVGLKVVNALSTNVVVTAFHYDGTAMKIETAKGYPIYKEPKPVPNKSKKQGSSVSFIPNTDILGDLNLSWRVPYDLIKHILSLTPIGSTCYFEAIDINGVAYKETIVNKDGIITDLIMKVQKPIIKPIITAFDDGEHKLETAFTWDFGDTNSGPLDNESVTSFSNFCPTREGTHIEGTIDGICTWLVKYMNDIYLSNQKAKDKLKVVANDIKTGLNVMISAAVLEPEFTGQAKERLSNDDMKPFCKEVVMRGMTEWSKNSPQDLQKIAKFIKDIAENRAKQEAGKAKIVQKYQSNSLTNLPSKYLRPLGKDHIELVIVEGDSAMGTVASARNRDNQGIFPIRGKIINAFNCTKERFYENEEVQAIHKIIFGRDYKRGDKVTLEDAKVEKVIIMADGDVDGAHISALLLRMFVMYYPFLIEAGMVYKALPPLFSAKIGKSEKYFTEQIDIIKFMQRDFLEHHKMLNAKRAPMDNKSTTIFFMRNVDYTYYLNKAANTYALYPRLVEMILFNYVQHKDKVDFNSLQKEIKATYRFMDAKMINKNHIKVSGVIDKSNVVIISDKFLSDCEAVIRILKANDYLYYYIDGEKKSLYEVMTAYEKSTPSGIKRYKGLGEMNKNQMAESTLRADMNRTLIRYTINDVKETFETIRSYESNSKLILNLCNNVTRDDLNE